MQLKAKARRRTEVCAEQVCVHTKWTGRGGRAAAWPLSLGLLWGRCRGAGAGVGPPDPSWALHQTHQTELSSSLRPLLPAEPAYQWEL